MTVDNLFAEASNNSAIFDSFRAEVVEVAAGKAFDDVLTDGSPHSEEVAFDDSRADWRTFHVRVRVLEVFGGDVAANSEVTLGLAFGSELSLEIVRSGFQSMRQLVAFTSPDSEVFSYDPSVQAVLYDGAFLSPVDNGIVSFPALTEDGHHSPKLIEAIDSLPELRAAS